MYRLQLHSITRAFYLHLYTTCRELVFPECKWPFILYHYSAHLLPFISHSTHAAHRSDLILQQTPV